MDLVGPSDMMLDQYREESYQRETVSFILSRLAPGMTVFDIGAHVGYVSRRMLSLGVKLVAFEPNRSVYEALVTNIGDEALCLNVAVGPPQMVSLSSPGHSGQTEARPDEAGKVPMIPLSSLSIIPDFIKLDAQGWDAEIVLGLLPHRCEVVMEWWPSGIRDVTGKDPDKLLTQLEEHYRVEHLDRHDAHDWWDLFLSPR